MTPESESPAESELASSVRVASAVDARDERTLGRLRKTARMNVAIGCILVLLGASYAGWALVRFDPRSGIEGHMSFDRPVSAVGRAYHRYVRIVHQIRAESSVEALLLESLERSIAFSAGMFITLLRVFLGLIGVLLGLVILTVVAERQRLLAILGRRS